jgi:hypothetical protein
MKNTQEKTKVQAQQDREFGLAILELAKRQFALLDTQTDRAESARRAFSSPRRNY